MEQGNMGRSKFYWLIGFLVLVTLVAVTFKYSMKGNLRGSSNNQQVVSVKNDFQKLEVSKEALPDKFPDNFPVEKDAAVEQNYNIQMQNGSTQATRSYKSTQSLEANEKSFNDYLKSNGWLISATHSEGGLRVISAVKASKQILVTISADNANKSVNVDITIVDSNK